MTTQALYNKWRGQTFSDILGQEHITRTLQNQIKAGRIGHAYLFTGVRGTGKTSTARIMAKAVNCVGGVDNPPCNQCHICRSITSGSSLDLIEIDGASNRGIDEIRDLRDKVGFAPNECRYKVYVIDEVHMLTNEAFNALLKTLEEPPAHVIFVLCTTEPHKVPSTVLSRCQRFDFRRGSVAVVTEKLQHICEQEQVRITSDALEFIARRAGGSFRDAESLLDQLSAYGDDQITLEVVQRILGSVPAALVNDLLRSLVRRDIPTGLRAINAALDNGAEPRQFLGEILDHLRALMLLRVGSTDAVTSLTDETLAEMRQIVAQGCSLGLIVEAIKLFNEAGNSLRNAVRPQLPLEVAFVEAILRTQGEPAPAVVAEQPQVSVARQAPVAAAPQVAAPPVVTPAATALPVAAQAAPAPAQTEPQAKSAVSDQPPAKRTRAPSARRKDKASVQEEAGATYTTPAPLPADESPAVQQAAPAVSQEQPTPSESAPASGQAPRKLTLDWVKGNWRQFTIKMRANDLKMQGFVNSAQPVRVQGDTIILGCSGQFGCSQLMEDKRREVVERVLSEVLDVPCRIHCIVSQQARQSRTDAPPEDAPDSLFDTIPPQAGVPQQTADDDLLNHPAVQEAKRLGGRIANVDIYKDKQEDNRG